MKTIKQTFGLFLIALLLFSSKANAQSTVVDVIVNSPDHSTLEAAVIAAELADDLSGVGPFTVFAPTNAAFDALPAGTVEALLADPTGELAQILLYHVASGNVMSSALSDGQMITTLQGKKVTVAINNDGVFVNGAKVTVADITADNGVVHVINAVLLPPAPTTVVDVIVNSPDHSTLEAAVIAAELADDLSGVGPFTVFAPTNAAFDALPAGTVDALLADPTGELAQILLYHVASGNVMSSALSDGQMITTLQGKKVTVAINNDGVFVNGAKVTVADITADNGVVHVINAVLLPPAPTTVVDVIVNSPDHSTLEAAVIAAELADDLSGVGPFTVFAPTNAAFDALPAGTVDALLADPTGELAQILLYHVASGNVMSGDLSDGQMITTLQGKKVTVDITEDGVFINSAKVTVANITADNGVVHVIDAVLLPPVVAKAAFPIDFETENDAVWEAFANGTGSPSDFMVIANPDKSGANTSDNVLKFLVNDNADPWAGAFSDSYKPIEITSSSYKVKLMVWKSVISPVGFKVEKSTNGGPDKELKVSNTLINQWEVITFDLSALIGFSYNRIAIFPDFPSERTSGTTVYFDNIMRPVATTVVDIIVNSADHSTLEAAVIAAELADDLSGIGPFTVFAPTNAAFDALPAGTVEALLADPKGDLAQILLYHVANGKVMSTDLSDGQTINTLLSKNISVSITADGVFINGAKVTVANITADNGVVHVIDAVLLPATGISNKVSYDTQLSIYPNPAKDFVRISGMKDVNKGQMKIINTNGAVMVNRYMNDFSESIDISSLGKGMYFMMIDAPEGRISGKFLVK